MLVVGRRASRRADSSGRRLGPGTSGYQPGPSAKPQPWLDGFVFLPDCPFFRTLRKPLAGLCGRSAGCGQSVRRRDHALLRYAEAVASTLDKDKLHDVLDQAVIVIDERDLERSRKDPRVRAFHESSARLMAELEAEGANYD